MICYNLLCIGMLWLIWHYLAGNFNKNNGKRHKASLLCYNERNDSFEQRKYQKEDQECYRFCGGSAAGCGIYLAKFRILYCRTESFFYWIKATEDLWIKFFCTVIKKVYGTYRIHADFSLCRNNFLMGTAVKEKGEYNK